jgi:putative heme-binding domain-containing protein
VRVQVLSALGELGRSDSSDAILALVGGKAPLAVQRAALEALARFDRLAIGQALVKRYPRLPASLRGPARAALLGRRTWAKLLVEAVERKQIKAAEVGINELRPLLQHRDRDLLARARKLWGKVGRGTPEEKLAEVRRLSNDLRAGSGDTRSGKVLFQKRCGTCHRLFNEGGSVGPDLTHANRRDRQYLLVSIVDPSAVIRKEYMASNVTTTDGRVLTGIVVEDRPGHVSLLTATGERVRISRARIERIHDSPVSLMPEDLLRDLKPQELRDLFAYLEGGR